ncbi:MAG TPA: DUF1588 domain-containing protein, partial [Polyangiaceae bacterium]|nr:DUF1588 domain-containing protein [Polyangiaceae bacterium]
LDRQASQPSRRRVARGALLPAALLAALTGGACTGEIAGQAQGAGRSDAVSVTGAAPPGDTSSATTTTGGGGTGSTEWQTDGGLGEQVGPDGVPLIRARAWRLTHAEYRASVRDLLGIEPVLEAPPPDAQGYYKNQAALLQVPLATAKYYFDAAESIAAQLTALDLTRLLPCGELTGCTDEFISTLVGRAFRRPAASEELQAYRALYDVGAAASDPAYAYRAVVQGVLNSPHFLYRTEIGSPERRSEQLFQLTDYEVASFLSYGLFGAPPSQALLEAASRGELVTQDGLATVVSALLATPEAAHGLRTFIENWLDIPDMRLIDKDSQLFTGYDENIQNAMQEEARAFIEQVGTLEGTAPALITVPVPSVSAALDAFYRGDASGAAGGSRLGGLALGSVLAEHGRFNLSSPVLRGLFVRNRVLCQIVESPPENVNTAIEPPMAGGPVQTTRQSFEAHTSNAVCQQCHQYIDTLGFPFESFDGAGRFRTMENGVAIDTTGELVGTDVDRPVANYEELVLAIAESANFRDCVALQGYRYLFGQMEPESEFVPQAVSQGREALATSGLLGDLLGGLLSADVSVLQRQR